MDSFSLINEPFPFSFAGKEYQVKKANLGQVMQFQRRSKEIYTEGDAAGDVRIMVYAIYLTLNAADSTVTEKYVEDNARGDLDFLDVISTLGFMSQQKIATMQKTRNLLDAVKPKPEATSGSTSTAQ